MSDGVDSKVRWLSEIVNRVKREAIIRKWSIPDDLFENISQAVFEGD